MAKKILIVGAGFTGATIARLLVDHGGFMVEVIDQRHHVAGNCHTENHHGIIEHIYGPHIFHTDQPQVFEFVKRFGNFYSYQHKVKAKHDGVYSLPINLLTICQVYQKELSPQEAIALINQEKITIKEPKNFEEQALSMVGEKIYHKFFKFYTERQWGVKATEIPAYILKRLPLRFNFEDSYFNHPIQVMPEGGYTGIVENMLRDKAIAVKTNTAFDKAMVKHYDHVFYTGKLDQFYDYQHGDLPYRTLRFEKQFLENTDYQGCAVMNNCAPNRGRDNDHTRITDYKYFHRDPVPNDSLIAKEFSLTAGRDDIPYYPVNLVSGNDMLDKYQRLAEKEDKVSFVGRLGSFQYLDMDKAILLAMNKTKEFLAR